MRAATKDDAEALAGVHVASWRSAYAGLLPPDLLASLDVGKRAQAWRTILDDTSGSAYLACEGEEVLGFIHVCPSRDEDKASTAIGEVTSIYVAPGRWGKGIGTTLLSRGLLHLAQAGCREVTLWVLDGNLPACRFYERNRFARDGSSKTHPPSGMNEVRYRLSLANQMPERIQLRLAALQIPPERIAAKRLTLQAEAENLVVVEVGADGRQHLLTPATAAAWHAMSAAAGADGVAIRIASAFRSVERQAEIVRSKLEHGFSLEAVLEVSAPPGYSEHHTGRAVDITTDGTPALEIEFERTAAF
ncbi:MAG TPA: GNAT family N-acetyltransferase, partial [Burkholderiales bacterium]|nr:GNAT family N-acetyltransferase [Burkholderiales bacterium]